MTKKKAQISMEFIILIVAILFFLTTFLLAIEKNLQGRIELNRDNEIKGIAMLVQTEIALAFETSDGYLRKFNTPLKVGGKDYNLTLIDNFIYVQTNDKKHAVALPIFLVSGSINNGQNIITKNNGTIRIN